MECSCCLVWDTEIFEGTARVDGINTVNADVSLTYDWWDETDQYCNPLAGKVDLMGPAIGTIELTGYPFDNTDNDPYSYMLRLNCPLEINVSIPFKWIWDCSTCSDCLDPMTGLIGGKRIGRWVPIPQKKRDIRITGDVSGIESWLMEFGDKLYKLNKLNIQATGAPFIVPQPTWLYRSFKYNFRPLIVDTTQDYIYTLSINPGGACAGAYGLPQTDAVLTGFTFSFKPPQAPVITYKFTYHIWFCNPGV